jgi:hypothetical protein
MNILSQISTLSNLRLPQIGGPGSCIHFPQEQGNPVVLYHNGFRSSFHSQGTDRTENAASSDSLSHQRRTTNSVLTLNERNIPFVNSVKYLGVIFDTRMAWRLHIEKIIAKAFRTFIRWYSLFKSERLSANIKLTLHKALIRSVMTYAYFA